jgi:hypothetical protein
MQYSISQIPRKIILHIQPSTVHSLVVLTLDIWIYNVILRYQYNTKPTVQNVRPAHMCQLGRASLPSA